MSHEQSKSVQASDLCGRARTPKKKTKKGRHLTMLGVAGGAKGYPIGLKFLWVSFYPNVVADANLEVDRTSGSGATTP